MRVWKIKNPDGKYSTGSAIPSFTNVGRVWGSKRDVNRHLNLKYYHDKSITVREYYRSQKCKLISYNLILDERKDI